MAGRWLMTPIEEAGERWLFTEISGSCRLSKLYYFFDKINCRKAIKWDIGKFLLIFCQKLRKFFWSFSRQIFLGTSSRFGGTGVPAKRVNDTLGREAVVPASTTSQDNNVYSTAWDGASAGEHVVELLKNLRSEGVTEIVYNFYKNTVEEARKKQ